MDNNSESAQSKPTPLRCVTGAAIAGSIGYAMYLLTISIAQTFANKPIQSDNSFVLNISQAVRTLVVGICSLATGIFAFATLGLILLAIQLLIQSFTKGKNENSA